MDQNTFFLGHGIIPEDWWENTYKATLINFNLVLLQNSVDMRHVKSTRNQPSPHLRPHALIYDRNRPPKNEEYSK